MKKSLAILVLGLIGILLMPISHAAPKKTIKFATEATYPPFVYMGSSGKMKGFDVEIIEALCQEMNAVCTISNQPWDSLIPSLNLGKYDALFGSMAITPARKNQVDFSHPYYKNSVSFLANKTADFAISKAGLKHKAIGVEGGSTFDAYLENTYGDLIGVARYPSIQEALMDLRAGRIDAVLGDAPLLEKWAKKDKNHQFELVGDIRNTEYFGAGDGIAVKKGDSHLLHELNKALSVIKANGMYDKIARKYFGSD